MIKINTFTDKKIVFYQNFVWKFNYFMSKKGEFECGFLHSKLITWRAFFAV